MPRRDQNRSRVGFLSSPARLFIFPAILIALTSCSVDDLRQADTGDPFETIEKGTHSGIWVERLEAIRDQATWETLWAEHKSSTSTTDPAPVVDFQNETVIAVFLGARSSGGYWTDITKVNIQTSEIMVYYDEHKPGSNCIVTLAITYPYHIIKILKTDSEPTFIKTMREYTCPSGKSDTGLTK